MRRFLANTRIINMQHQLVRLNMDAVNGSVPNYEFLIEQANSELNATTSESNSHMSDLDDARELALKAGLSIESDLPGLSKQIRDGVMADASTGGHSNTDHVIRLTGDYATDRVMELRRNMLIRARAERPECRGEEKWDKPRSVGERRRRIVRDRDISGPPDPPLSAYVLYLGQMTTKIRHDRWQTESHNQALVAQEISKLWKLSLRNSERLFYEDLTILINDCYKKQNLEFRATGHFTESTKFMKLKGVGPWVHRNEEDRNELEKTICKYDMVVFPPRPFAMNAEYDKRHKESVARRKKKVKAEMLAKQQKQGTKSRRQRGISITEEAKNDETEAAKDNESITAMAILNNDPDVSSKQNEVSRQMHVHHTV